MASRLIAFYAEIAAAKRNSSIGIRGYCTDLELVTFTVDPPRIKATERSSKASSIKVGRGMSQYIQPLENSNNYAAFMVQRGHFHQTMVACEYETSHADSERDYKEASFKIQQYKAKQKALAEGEELPEEDQDDLEHQKKICMDAVAHMKTCATNYKSAYMKFIGDGSLGSKYDGIVRRELETEVRHRTKDYKLKEVAFLVVPGGDNIRAPEFDKQLDDLPEGYESGWYPMWRNTDYVETPIGTTMKGVKRTIELHKFAVSQGFGRAEAQRNFLLQHVSLPGDLSMDVRAVANLIEAISGYMSDLPCRKDNPEYEDNDDVVRANVPFTQMEMCDMLKNSLPHAVQKLLAIRSAKDEIFLDYAEFTDKVVSLTAEARLATPIPKKKNDDKSSDGRNKSNKGGSHKKNHQQSTNGKNCGRCAAKGKGERCVESHNDSECNFFNADGTAKTRGKKTWDKKFDKKKNNFNHNLDTLSPQELKAIRKDLASHSRRSRSSSRSSKRSRSRSRSESSDSSDSDESSVHDRSRRRGRNRNRKR